MHGVDTNVLVRLLVRDDERQFRAARSFVLGEAERGEPVLVGLLVLVETEWVLRSRYRRTKEEIADAFVALLSAVDIVIEDEASLEIALRRWRSGAADFADCLIATRHEALGCRGTATFDRRASAEAGFLAL